MFNIFLWLSHLFNPDDREVKPVSSFILAMDRMLAVLMITAFICSMFQGNLAAAVVEDEYTTKKPTFDGQGPSMDSIDAFTGVYGNLDAGKI